MPESEYTERSSLARPTTAADQPAAAAGGNYITTPAHRQRPQMRLYFPRADLSPLDEPITASGSVTTRGRELAHRAAPGAPSQRCCRPATAGPRSPFVGAARAVAVASSASRSSPRPLPAMEKAPGALLPGPAVINVLQPQPTAPPLPHSERPRRRLSSRLSCVRHQRSMGLKALNSSPRAARRRRVPVLGEPQLFRVANPGAWSVSTSACAPGAPCRQPPSRAQACWSGGALGGVCSSSASSPGPSSLLAASLVSASVTPASRQLDLSCAVGAPDAADLPEAASCRRRRRTAGGPGVRSGICLPAPVLVGE